MSMKKFVLAASAASLVTSSTMVAAASAPVRPYSVRLAETRATALNGTALSGRAGAVLKDPNAALPGTLTAILALLGLSVGLAVVASTGDSSTPAPTPTPTPTPTSPG